MRRLKALLILIILLFGGYLLFSSVDLRSPVRKEESSSLVFVPDGELEAQVTLFFPNQDYVISGNVELSRMLPVVRRVRYKEGEFYAGILQELRRPPADREFSTALRDDLQVLSARRQGSTLYLDFSSKNLHGGSLEETLLVEQIVKTMVGLDEIEQVQFLVDGEVRESLMGHIGTEEPLTLNDVE
ncbi:MAG TPA: GerMN domain-containing protein [Firmicutes bacterium]|nr:GerMN domain-containing protein [Bacillota bacterium]